MQHALEWEQYQNLSSEEKRVYFDDRENLQNSLLRHFEADDSLRFQVNRDIVDVIIGDLLFDPDDEDVALSRERALSLFRLSEDVIGNVSNAQDAYTVTIKSSKQFRLAQRFVACGASFRMASRLIAETKDETGLSFLAGCSEGRVSQFIRVIVAVNLQKLFEVVKSAWAFSIGLDSGNSAGMNYLDTRIRFYRGGCLYNLHFLALPLHDRKTADYLFRTLSKALDIVIPDWRTKLMGISSDGENTMTGRINGVVTKIQAASDGKDIWRVWCALHQIDLVVQDAYKRLLNGDFIDNLVTVIGYLRRQQNLICEMGSTCPKLMLSRWAHMHRSTQWFVDHRVRVTDCFAEKNPACKPSDAWYVAPLAMAIVDSKF
jgi:hypothetical protein